MGSWEAGKFIDERGEEDALEWASYTAAVVGGWFRARKAEKGNVSKACEQWLHVAPY